MRAVGVHADVVVVTSQVWQTSCTFVRGGDEAFAIDSPVLPTELEALPSLAEQAGFAVAGLLGAPALLPLCPTPLLLWAAAALGVFGGTTTAMILRRLYAAPQRRSLAPHTAKFPYL